MADHATKAILISNTADQGANGVEQLNDLLTERWKIVESVRVGNEKTENGSMLLILQEGGTAEQRAVLIKSTTGERNGVATINQLLGEGWNEKQAAFAVNDQSTLLILGKSSSNAVGFAPGKW